LLVVADRFPMLVDFYLVEAALMQPSWASQSV